MNLLAQIEELHLIKAVNADIDYLLTNNRNYWRNCASKPRINNSMYAAPV
jgi:hypothetical protein